jgi:hypothetical protein
VPDEVEPGFRSESQDGSLDVLAVADLDDRFNPSDLDAVSGGEAPPALSPVPIQWCHRSRLPGLELTSLFLTVGKGEKKFAVARKRLPGKR